MPCPPGSLFFWRYSMLVMESAAPEKVQLNKKIYGWGELDAAVTDKARLTKETPLSQEALARCLKFFGHARMAQIEERVLAVACGSHISLVYTHTSPGCGLESLEIQRHVNVYPAQGGRTSYEIDMKVNGYFANKHLPMRAKDRGGKSIYRNTKWYYGQSGMYQPGVGPLYCDIGPTCQAATHEEIVQKITAADWIAESWRDRAVSFLDKVTAAVAPFGDAVVRFEVDGLDRQKDGDPIYDFSLQSWVSGYETVIRSEYGALVKIKHPARKDSGGWEHQPDLVVAVTGPPAGWQDPEDLLYMVSRAHGGGGRVPLRDRAPQGTMNAIYRKQSSIVDVVRQWCGEHINIPA